MKNHTLLSDVAVLLLIIFLFIVPPFFALAVSAAKPLTSLTHFPWYQLLLAFFGTLILFFYYEKSHKTGLIIFPVLFTFGMLFSISLFCRFLSEVFAGAGASDISEFVIRPEGLVQWIFCLINFLSAAFYEEVLYRFYLSDALLSVITRKKTFRLAWILCEAAGLLAFAFAHLYMGWISVLNAALAHILLRLCFKKTGKLWPCVASHFIYNVISLILL